jgi:hypothetical protein
MLRTSEEDWPVKSTMPDPPKPSVSEGIPYIRIVAICTSTAGSGIAESVENSTKLKQELNNKRVKHNEL